MFFNEDPHVKLCTLMFQDDCRFHKNGKNAIKMESALNSSKLYKNVNRDVQTFKMAAVTMETAK